MRRGQTKCRPVLVSLVLSLLVMVVVLVAPAEASDFTVTVDYSSQIGVNHLQIGSQIVFEETAAFPSSTIRESLLANASLKVIRVFDYQIGYPSGQPCMSWNDASRTGTFDWTAADNLINAILSVGAEPLIVIGFASSTGLNHKPSGMGQNVTTGLPNPDVYAAYVSYWANRYKGSVRYWDIVNEPFKFFGSAPNLTRLGYFLSLYDASYNAMKSVSSGFSVAFDSDSQQTIVNYLVAHNIPIDRIEYHKYDSNTANPLDPRYESDSELYSEATVGSFFNGHVQQAQAYYLAQTGRNIPVWDTESNMNSAWNGGTDSRMVMMNGTIWDALTTRTEILNGVSVRIHFQSTTSWTYANSKAPYGGYGFGLLNTDANKPTLPYWLYYVISNNLAAGDWLCSSNSSSANLQTLAWKHGTTNNLLLIHNTTSTDTVYLSGFVDGTIYSTKLDTSVPFDNSGLLAGTVSGSSIVMAGYTIALLQQTTTQGSNGIPGDLNGDARVDIFDALSLLHAYNSVPTSVNWNANADINRDNRVDIFDAMILADNYGRTG